MPLYMTSLSSRSWNSLLCRGSDMVEFGDVVLLGGGVMSACWRSSEVREMLGVSRARLDYLVRLDGVVRVVSRDRVYFEEDVLRLRELDGRVRRVPLRGRRRKEG